MTAHRRENFGERLDNILLAIKNLHKSLVTINLYFLCILIQMFLHRVLERLKGIPNVILTKPLDYPETICLIKNAKLILTDSGGIQEEAPTFGTPILVMRYETERTEGVDAGFSKLVGADECGILKEARAVLKLDRDKTRLDGSKRIPMVMGMRLQEYTQ
nr:UDP-N-acetylglucosamine 2-epimerase [Helicobacter winghamensis]